MTTSATCETPHSTDQRTREETSEIPFQTECERDQTITSEFNLMEMTEVEYTHLQRLIQSHMGTPTAEHHGSVEDRLHLSSTDDENENHPSTCASKSSSEYTDRNDQNIKGLQEMNREHVGSSDAGEKTPTQCGKVPTSVLNKIKWMAAGVQDHGVCRRASLGSRPDPPIRVRLEKMFGGGLWDLNGPREKQAAVLNMFLSLRPQSTDQADVTVHSQSDVRSNTARTAAGECPFPQELSLVPQLPEGQRHPEVPTPTHLSSTNSSKQTAESDFRSDKIYADTRHEHRAADVENDVGGEAMKRSVINRSRVLRVLQPNRIQNSENLVPVYHQASCEPRSRAGPSLRTSNRREKHNNKERDRRRRIRLCCDELNLLVPFCNPHTDKATTLQWTAAYLTYINGLYGDSLKQDFQRTFGGDSGLQMETDQQ